MLLPFFLCLTLVSGTPTPFDLRIQEARKAAANFETDQAAASFQEASKLNPQSLEAFIGFLRASNAKGQQLLYGENERRQSKEIFEKNLERAKNIMDSFGNAPESPFALAVTHGNLALLSHPKQKVLLAKEIEPLLLRSINIDPKFPYSYLGLGIFYKEISKITGLERFFADLFWGKLPQGDLMMSEAFLRKSIDLDPNFLFSHYHLGDCLELQERFLEASEQYRFVIQNKPTDYNDGLWKTLAAKALQRVGPEIKKTSGLSK